MDKKILTPIIIAVIIAGGAGFLAGKHVSASALQANSASTRTGGQFGMGGMRGGRNGAGFASGQIISADDKSITVELRAPAGGAGQTQGSGSKIIFLADSTQIMKTVDGAKTDLVVGKTVTVSGTPNQDGSINATSIQIRTAPPQSQTPSPTASQ